MDRQPATDDEDDDDYDDYDDDNWAADFTNPPEPVDPLLLPPPPPPPQTTMTLTTQPQFPSPPPPDSYMNSDDGNGDENLSEIDRNTMKSYKLSVEVGKFGWNPISDHESIPFIMRNVNQHEYFVPTRMVNITKYLKTLHLDIFYKCLSIDSFFISNYEANLLTVINSEHCDNVYGSESFYTNKDFIVRLEDVVELYAFLECCTKKLKKSTSKIQSNKEKFGFIHIYLNSKINSYVPFVKKDGHKCVPLFFFEGQIENLKDHIFELEGWDLTYLKFCCRVQDIKAEFYSESSCAVVSLDNIIQYFELETTFEDFWPSETIELSQLLHCPKTEEVPSDSWFKKPYYYDYINAKKINRSNSPTTELQTVVLLPARSNSPTTELQTVVLLPTRSNSPTTELQTVVLLPTQSNSPTSELQRVAPLPIQSNILTTSSAYEQQIVEPLPLLPPQSPIISNLSLNLPNHRQPSNASDFDVSFGVGGNQSAIRNPLLLYNDHTTVNSSLLNKDNTNVQAHHRLPQPNLLNTNSVTPQMTLIDSVSQNTQECNAKNKVKPPEFKIVDTFSDPATQSEDTSVIELIRIQERDWQISSSQLAYEVKSTTLQGNIISFINKSPYDYSVVLVTLKDVVKWLIPFSNIEICGLIFQNELHKTLYCGNTEQISLLYKNGVADNQIPIRTPLINLRDVNDNLEDLELMANLLHEKYFKK
ncbi:Hypothetical protein CINCED_3A024864 [Cinara cedri]|uniref:Uncharacterized protein n=1 Tax=Cinara cedri TaxID=506608 RepID=A0A5E4M2J4_9HEMI|nr:Hypothetical protein CINCED_3A024864 [Cinara cedri]